MTEVLKANGYPKHIIRSAKRPRKNRQEVMCSDVATVVKGGSQGIKHIPERLARMLTLMLEDEWLRRVNDWITGPE